MEQPTGFDVPNVTAWLRERLEHLAPPLRWTALTGGHSNFTYRVDAAEGSTFVLRRPPLGELLPMAHDMGREYTLISALWPSCATNPPSPRSPASCPVPDPGTTNQVPETVVPASEPAS